MLPAAGVEDWWLLDSARLIVMRFDREGHRIENELVTDPVTVHGLAVIAAISASTLSRGAAGAAAVQESLRLIHRANRWYANSAMTQAVMQSMEMEARVGRLK